MVMTSSELNELNRKLPELKKPELNCALRNVIASHLEVLAILDGHEEAEKNMTRDYQTMKELSETLKRENERLTGSLRISCGQPTGRSCTQTQETSDW